METHLPTNGRKGSGEGRERILPAKMIRECGLHAYRARECVGVNAFSRGESARSGSECEVRRAAARLLLREE